MFYECDYFPFTYNVAESVGYLRPTSSGVRLWTGLLFTSSMWSPMWINDNRSGLRAAESKLRESDNQ